MNPPDERPMSLAERVALAAIAGALIVGTLAYGVLRLYAF
jgi:hypothetical protein